MKIRCNVILNSSFFLFEHSNWFFLYYYCSFMTFFFWVDSHYALMFTSVFISLVFFVCDNLMIYKLLFENSCNLFIEHVQNIPFIILFLSHCLSFVYQVQYRPSSFATSFQYRPMKIDKFKGWMQINKIFSIVNLSQCIIPIIFFQKNKKKIFVIFYAQLKFSEA